MPQHGIELKHFNSYLRVCEELGLPGYLAILQILPFPLLLVEELEYLKKTSRVYRGPSMTNGMIYFDVASFREIKSNIEELISNNLPTPLPTGKRF